MNALLTANTFSGQSISSMIIVALVAVAVLAVSCCCPELLSDFVRWIIGKVVNS